MTRRLARTMDTTPRSVTIQPVIHFDAKAPIVVDVPADSTPESEFSRRRTALSGHRTGLSEHRTALSEHRTALSENRTTLSTLRSHLSNERTHLSYLRTAISLVGFGITLNRFAIYLIQNERLAALGGGKSALRDTKSIGLGMVVLGFSLLAWSLFRFYRTSRDIEARRYHTDWRAVWVMSGLFLALGVVTTLWLFLR
jgi:inner membrane protein YidH